MRCGPASGIIDLDVMSVQAMNRVTFRQPFRREHEFKVDDAWYSWEYKRVIVAGHPYKKPYKGVKEECVVPDSLLKRHIRHWRTLVELTDAIERDFGKIDKLNRYLKKVLVGRHMPFKKLRAETKRFKNWSRSRDRKAGFVKLRGTYQIYATVDGRKRLRHKFKKLLSDMKIEWRGRKISPIMALMDFQYDPQKNIVIIDIGVQECMMTRNTPLNAREDYKDIIGNAIEDFTIIRSTLGFAEVY